MKTLFKTLKAPLRASVLLAAVVALVALSCSPEVSLSDRDWDQINADKEARTANTDTTSYLPSVAWVSNGAGNSPSYRELTVTIPKVADVLKTGNDKIAKEMQKFLNFYAFTRGTDAVSVPDTLGTAYGYSFVRREDGGNDVIITVKLDDYDVNDNPALVAKVDASKYTFMGGKKVVGANDTLGGDAIYDKYTTLKQYKVTGTSNPDQGNYDFIAPYQGWDVSAPAMPQPKDSDTSFTGVVLDLRTSISLPGNTYTTSLISTDNANARRSLRNNIAASTGIKDKLSLEQFDYASNKWVAATGTFNYNDLTSTSSTPDYSGRITVTYSPAEFVPYRVKLSGVKNLKTSGSFYGAAQRIKVDGGFIQDVYYSPVTVRVDKSKHDRAFPTSVIKNVTFETLSNQEGKGLKVHLVFNPVAILNTNYYVSSAMDTKTFNNNFKIAVANGINSSTKLSNTEFLKVDKVEFGATSEVILTLNSVYTYDYLNSKNLTFLIAPGFKYTNDNIFFGDYSNWDWVIDGVRNFGTYGTMTVGNYSAYIPETSRIISFNSNGATGYVYDVVIGETPVALPDSTGLTYTGNTFIGWSTSSYGGTFYKGSYDYSAFPNSYKVELFAQWVLNDTTVTEYTITFDLNGGSGVATPPAQKVPSGYSIQLPAVNGLKKSGDVFVGWAESATATIGNTRTYYVYANKTLYAIYADPNPLDAPTNLTATQVTGTLDVNLAWTNVTDNNGYKVYRDGRLVSPAWTNSFIDSDVTPGSHTYTVKTVNDLGFEGAGASKDITVVMPTPTVTSTSVSNTDEPAIVFTLSGISSDYVVQYNSVTDTASGGFYSYDYTFGADSNITFTFVPEYNGETFYYASASTTILAAPQNLTATKTTDVDLAWDAVPGAASYYVYNTTTGSPKVSSTTNSYTDSSGSSGDVYIVTAVNYDGTEGFGSEKAIAATP